MTRKKPAATATTKAAVAPATKATVAAPTKPVREPPKPIILDRRELDLLVRGGRLALAFKPTAYTSLQKAREALVRISSGDSLNVAEDYYVENDIMSGLRDLVATGSLTADELACAKGICDKFVASKGDWYKDHVRLPEPSAEWRIRHWLLEHGYAEHLHTSYLGGNGMPPGVVAAVNRWRSDVDGKHVLAIYPDRVREATLTTPYNHTYWHIRDDQAYETPEELDAILRPFVTKPGTVWDAPKPAASPVVSSEEPTKAETVVTLRRGTVNAIRRALAIRLDASDADVKLVRDFLAQIGGG